MRIAICDDEPLYREEIKQICKEYEKEKNNVKLTIIECSTGEEVLALADSIDIVILDIDLPFINGIEVKEKMYKMDNKPIIIFITNHQELMQEAFGVSVCGFITKPIQRELFYQIFDKAFIILSMNCKINIGDKNNSRYLDTRDILYIESDKVYTKVVTQNEYHLIRKSLNQWEQELSSYGFYRIHKSFLINMDNVLHIGETACIKNKEELKISRSIKKEFTNVYNKHCLKMARYI